MCVCACVHLCEGSMLFLCSFLWFPKTHFQDFMFSKGPTVVSLICIVSVPSQVTLCTESGDIVY